MKTKPKSKTSKNKSTVKGSLIEPPRSLLSLTVKELQKLIRNQIKESRVLVHVCLNGIDLLASKSEEKETLCNVLKLCTSLNNTLSKVHYTLIQGEIKL